LSTFLFITDYIRRRPLSGIMGDVVFLADYLFAPDLRHFVASD